MIDLLIISSLALLAFAAAIFIDRVGIPRVTTYLLVGILASPHLLGQFYEMPILILNEMVTEIALGIIAFLIGIEIDWEFLRKHRKTLLFSSFGEVLLSVVFVTATLYFLMQMGFLGYSTKLVIALGAIAATTAPAGTMAVIEEYGAKGPMTTMLLGIVILDDALGVIIFETFIGFFENGAFATKGIAILVNIGGAVILGGILGAVSGLFARKFTKEELRLPLFVCLILMCTSTASLLHLSPLLACMILGFTTQFVSKKKSDDLRLPIKHIQEVVFITFFVLAGMHFDPTVFGNSLALIAVYIGARSLGKYIGAFWGASLGGLPTKKSKWLGLGLLPQAGVAIGLSLTLIHREAFASDASLIINVVLGATIIYEIIGPLLAKLSLMKAGELA